MCTVVVCHRPGSAVPLLFAGIRDEMIGRAWEPPGRHWDAYPGLIGGRDLLADGTWMALNPAEGRVAGVLNGRGTDADERGRRSRGELPLRAAATGDLDVPEAELAHFDAFHLVLGDRSGVRMWSWDGSALKPAGLDPGTHTVVNTGIDSDEPRAARFASLFAATPPTPRLAGGTVQTPAEAWGEWLPLAEGDGLSFDDPAAVIHHRPLPDGRIWGTTSVSLVAIGDGGVRYDFSGRPGDSGAWRTLLPVG
ncbi:MAG: hypothetical protein GEV11_22575 [Streptosporangiales bacterium]|nr:hypothetical protein [Streptosporangiales bacterium]